MKIQNLKNRLPLLLCLLSVLSLNIYFRAFPVYFPQFKKQARGMIEDSIRQEAVQGIAKRFPEYNALARDKLISNLASQYKEANKKLIEERTENLYAQMKDRYQDSAGQTYLMELDCWHWARYVDNIIHLGHPGDEVTKGRQKDTLMLAPNGAFMAWNNFLFYFSAYAYKTFSAFWQVPLFTFLFYLPFLFISLFIVVLYLFAFRQGGNIAGVIACLIAGLSAIFIPRSCAGWFDADILDLLFPLLIIWPYISSYTAGSPNARFFRVVLSAFWVGLFCAVWLGWWFIFFVIILYECYCFARLFIEYKIKKALDIETLKTHASTLGYFAAFSVIWIFLFCGISPLLALFNNVKESLMLNKPLISAIWPNVYSTVGELKPFNLTEIANSSGGKTVFMASVAAMFIFLWQAVTGRETDTFKRKSTLILFLWFASMFFACFKGVRFTMFILVPSGIFLGRLINEGYELAKKRWKPWVASLAAAAIVAMVAYPVSKKAYATSCNIVPLIDDNWYNVLTLVKERTPKEAILNSWWDFGDWFKVIGARRVIFDGQSQNSPQAYWMAKVLLSGSEDEAIAILRMLNNGGNRAFEIIDAHLKNPLKSVLLLEGLLPSSPQRAKEVLSKFLPPPAAEEVLRLLFDAPAKAYFIVDHSMQFKIAAISFLGNWDFDKVYLTQNFNKLERGELTDYLVKLGRSSQETQRIYQEMLLIPEKDRDDWISHRLQYYSGAVNGKKKGDQVLFDNGFVYNPDQQTIYSGDHKMPQSLFVLFKQDNLVEIIYPSANLGLSALVYRSPDQEDIYQLALLNRELAGSLFTRLYFMDGKGLRHFRPFIVSGSGGNFVRIFEIEWGTNG